MQQQAIKNDKSSKKFCHVFAQMSKKMPEERKKALKKMLDTLELFQKEMVLYFLLGWCEDDERFWQGLMEVVLDIRRAERCQQ